VTVVRASLTGQKVIAHGVQHDPTTGMLKDVVELHSIPAFGYTGGNLLANVLLELGIDRRYKNSGRRSAG